MQKLAQYVLVKSQTHGQETASESSDSGEDHRTLQG